MTHNFDAARNCERSEELLAYLYDEASGDERKIFEQHMSGCAECREEHAAFGGVHRVITYWRDESFAEAASLFPLTTPPQRAEKRSALRAVQEFLRLAPVWMQAGGAIALLLLCTLAVLFVNAEIRSGQNKIAFDGSAREQERAAAPPATDATQALQKSYSQQEVDLIVAEHVRRGIESYREQASAARQPSAAAATAGETTEANGKSVVRDTRVSFTRSNDSRTNARRGSNRTANGERSPRERQPSLARRANDGVPRLSDLLDEVN